MTTAAQVIPALEVPAPDDNMDVLSDTAFDFGDGDIDLDLDTAPSVHDDDMSLNDVGSDGGLDLQEALADQDDFMADHGDLIEDDDMYVGDEITTVEPQTTDDTAVAFEADMLAPPDEDLIDYSDDEAEQPAKLQSLSVPDDEDAQGSFDIEAASTLADDHHEDVQTQEDTHTAGSTGVSHEEVQTSHDDVAGTVGYNVASPERQPQSPRVVGFQATTDEDEPVHADDVGGVMLPTDEYSHNDDDTAEVQHEDVQQVAVDVEQTDDSEEQNIELRPVTVNYAGNELWLFKQHDLDESGDFLLEDLSVAKTSISGLFQACRRSLGDDVSGEHEIGFRFDHLHNLELYEDNTACVAVSLERLVDLYHTLQAQDGNEDPECFYITLQFRPRFATLLANVAQYAEQGSGYSALDAAVAAGETHFSNMFSSNSTEHENVEWDDEENDDEEASSPSSTHSIAQHGVDNNEPVKHQLDDVEDVEASSSQDRTEQPQSVDAEDDLHQPLAEQDDESHHVPEAANIEGLEDVASQEPAENQEVVRELELEATVTRLASESRDDRTPDQIAHDKQEADDFVDYSDDEEDQDVRSAPAHKPSPSSSTVQGDEPTEIQESGAAPKDEIEDNEITAETGFHEHEDDATLLTQTQYGDDAKPYAFQDYAETYDQDTYDQGDPFQEFQAESAVGDPFEANSAFNDDTNQDFTDYNFQTLEGEVNLNFDEPPLDDANNGDRLDETFAVDENVTDADAFLDLDNAPEWAIDADPAPNLPGEDAVLLHDDDNAPEDTDGGSVDQSAASMSTAANLASTSSNEHKLSSPQGQKRSIDEVGYGNDDAPDSTGMISCSPHERRFCSNVVSPDTKRPRV